MAHSPEQELYIHVILQALRDARDLNPAMTSAKRVALQGAARRWIAGCGGDFQLVCSHAGIDALAFSQKFRAGKLDLNTADFDKLVSGRVSQSNFEFRHAA